jgi:hypothetical protein
MSNFPPNCRGFIGNITSKFVYEATKTKQTSVMILSFSCQSICSHAQPLYAPQSIICVSSNHQQIRNYFPLPHTTEGRPTISLLNNPSKYPSLIVLFSVCEKTPILCMFFDNYLLEQYLALKYPKSNKCTMFPNFPNLSAHLQPSSFHKIFLQFYL